MKIKEDVASVYIIQNIDLPKRIKIGYSNNVARRLSSLRSQSGCEMELVYKSKPIYNYGEIESGMHKIFIEYRGIGEWFHMNSNLAVNRLIDMTSSSEVCKIVKLFESGRNATYIAKEMDVSRSGIVKYLNSKGYMIPKTQYRRIRKKEREEEAQSITVLSTDRIQEMVKATNAKLGKRPTCRS